jgi:Tfp pilus assembly ATPase PilU
MQTFDQALLKLIMAGKIEEEVAFANATSPHDLKLMLSARGQRASGIEQLKESSGGDGDGSEDSLQFVKH